VVKNIKEGSIILFLYLRPLKAGATILLGFFYVINLTNPLKLFKLSFKFIYAKNIAGLGNIAQNTRKKLATILDFGD